MWPDARTRAAAGSMSRRRWGIRPIWLVRASAKYNARMKFSDAPRALSFLAKYSLHRESSTRTIVARGLRSKRRCLRLGQCVGDSVLFGSSRPRLPPSLKGGVDPMDIRGRYQDGNDSGPKCEQTAIFYRSEHRGGEDLTEAQDGQMHEID